jgi:large subunit ribosomal protein L25
MEKLVLQAKKRTVIGKQVKQLRRQGLLPAVVYGNNMEPVNITLDAHTAGLSIPRLTSSSIVTIELDGKQIPALVREKQKNYVKGVYTHIDFLAVSLTEKLRTYVSLHFHGTAPAVKDFQAAIVTSMEEIEVEALPADLPERIEVDLSGLAKVGDAIHVRDLVIPAKVEVLSDGNEIVVVATATKEEALDEAGAEAAEPELSVERGKKEEEK